MTPPGGTSPTGAGQGASLQGMPLPKSLARINKRITNPIMRHFHRVPPMAIVVHRGRSSGKEYRTPVFAFPTEEGFAVALTYGHDVDWLKNVQAAGICSLIRKGRETELTNPRVVGWALGSKHMPMPVRITLLGLQARDFLLLDEVSVEG
jgi:deazaflavin-dependent oxidoreductase (nitroreductase family)